MNFPSACKMCHSAARRLVHVCCKPRPFYTSRSCLDWEALGCLTELSRIPGNIELTSAGLWWQHRGFFSAEEDIWQLFSQTELSSWWRVNWTLCVASVETPLVSNVCLCSSGFRSVEHRQVWQVWTAAEVPPADGRFQKGFPTSHGEHWKRQHGTGKGRTAAATARASGRIWTRSLAQNGLQ